MTEELYPATVLIKAFYLQAELQHAFLVERIQHDFPQLELKSHRQSLSKNQKYQVSSLEIEVSSQAHLQALYQSLTQDPLIKMVL